MFQLAHRFVKSFHPPGSHFSLSDNSKKLDHFYIMINYSCLLKWSSFLGNCDIKNNLWISGNVALTSFRPVLRISVKFLFFDDVTGDVTGELLANKLRSRSSCNKNEIHHFQKLFFSPKKTFTEKWKFHRINHAKLSLYIH
jgi:hypothetical protein